MCLAFAIVPEVLVWWFWIVPIGPTGWVVAPVGVARVVEVELFVGMVVVAVMVVVTSVNA